MQGQISLYSKSLIYWIALKKLVYIDFYIQHTLFAKKAGISDLTEHSLGML